ncbi:C2 domain-containing protein 5-like [Plakobranchus ocellatus]|uniref:C2 domain-containing protein 5-like n=1 Tax=Plakobranchus ocellatus TaxID=259542 RepID=A0AAV4C9N1_9GAST|nr:C2 domain-containing protein 5-like [Plakobranchus ocellatus]
MENDVPRFEVCQERQGDVSPHSRPPTDDESDDDEGDEGNYFLEKTKDKNTFVLVIDDVKDESVSLMLHDIVPPDGFDICNTQTLPGGMADKIVANLQMFTQMLTLKHQPQFHTSLDFSNIFNSILRRLCFKMRHFRPCCLTDVSFHVDIPDEDEMNVTVTGCCLGLQDSLIEPSTNSTNSVRMSGHSRSLESQTSSISMATANQTEEMIFPLEGVGDQASGAAAETSQSSHQSRQGSVSSRSITSKIAASKQSKIAMRPKVLRGVELTPLNKIYNGKIDRYLGYYNFFFIRESTAVKEGGGIGGFLQSFILEVKAIVRAHVVALGGNALVAYNMSQCVLDDNPHKNQGQCLINVSGDVVVVCYDEDERESTFVETPLTISAS